jgi:hypothetical protein
LQINIKKQISIKAIIKHAKWLPEIALIVTSSLFSCRRAAFIVSERNKKSPYKSHLIEILFLYKMEKTDFNRLQFFSFKTEKTLAVD